MHKLPSPANLSSETTEGGLGRRLLLGADCAAASGSGNLRPQRCGAPCTQGRLQKLMDRRGTEQGLLRAGLDAHCHSPSHRFGTTGSAESTSRRVVSASAQGVGHRAPHPGHGAGGGAGRSVAGPGVPERRATGRRPQRTSESPFLALGLAVLSTLLLGSTMYVHMALKGTVSSGPLHPLHSPVGQGSRGPQRWVLPCGMQRGRCCSLLLASPGRRALAHGAGAAPRGRYTTAPPARAGLTPALGFMVPMSSQSSDCALAPLTHDVSVVIRV